MGEDKERLILFSWFGVLWLSEFFQSKYLLLLLLNFYFSPGARKFLNFIMSKLYVINIEIYIYDDTGMRDIYKHICIFIYIYIYV